LLSSGYNIWIQRILEQCSEQRITKIRDFLWLIVGIYHSRSVNLCRAAGKIPVKEKLVSITLRLSRMLMNPAIAAGEWYEPIARQWLESQAKHGQQIRLIVDGCKGGFVHQLLIISLVYRRPAIPIVWTWVAQVCGIVLERPNWIC